MADGGDKNSSANKLTKIEENNDKDSLDDTPDFIEESFTRPGSQLEEKQTFKSKNGETISAYPVIVDFRRLLQLSAGPEKLIVKDGNLIQGVSNRDLLHAVVGLYDVCLSEMTPDVLYSTVCEKWARTIILVRDLKETIRDVEERRKKSEKAGENEENESSSDKSESKGSELTADEDVFEAEDGQPSKFAEVFSDTESEEEEEEEDDEEDFSKGINAFIQSVTDRRKLRKSHQGPYREEHVGIENRIIGCATFEKKYVKHKDRVIHLTIVSVRRRCRKYGIGKYLLSQIIDPSVVGHYDAVVVHADNAAVEFFQKFGFSDDIVLNSRWSELAEQFTNCTLMCYLPGFSGHRLLSTIKVPGAEEFEIEQEFNKWKEKTIEVYQQQVTCMTRMKHEILQLKYMRSSMENMTTSQNQFLEALVQDNDRLKREKLLTEKEFLDYRLCTARASFSVDGQNKGSPEDDISTEELIRDLQRQVDKMDIAMKEQKNHPRGMEPISPAIKKSTMTVVDDSRYMAFPTADSMNGEPYDHIKDAAFFFDVTEQFKQAMRLDPTCTGQFEVTTISKAVLSETAKKQYRERIRGMKDPTMVIDLYFCGSLERPERIQEILKHGFSDGDFTHGEYGKGLYFSKYPSKAAHFSALKKLLKVEVGLGNVESVPKPDRTRKTPGSGYDSIIVPGRLTHHPDDGDPTMNQEYVVFNPRQVLPLCLLSYESSKNT